MGGRPPSAVWDRWWLYMWSHPSSKRLRCSLLRYGRADAEKVSSLAKGVANPVGLGVVGHHPLHSYALGGEELARADQEARASVHPLVGVGLGVRQAAVVIHRGMDVVVAGTNVVGEAR